MWDDWLIIYHLFVHFSVRFQVFFLILFDLLPCASYGAHKHVNFKLRARECEPRFWLGLSISCDHLLPFLLELVLFINALAHPSSAVFPAVFTILQLIL